MGCRAIVLSNQGQMPHAQALPHQGSLSSLTLDEMQDDLSVLVKPLNAIKAGKLLDTVASVEQQQNHVQSSSSISVTNNAPLLPGNLSVNGTICQKAMDEMWCELVQQDKHGDAHEALENTTLEDFLVRAGAVNYESQGDVVVMDSQPLMAAVLDPMVQQQADMLHYHLAATQQMQQQKKMAVFETGIPMFSDVVVGGYDENEQKGAPIMPLVPLAMVKSTLADSQATGMLEAQQPNEQLDKNIDRKRKRMIKNRESAARSRAKKQAYITQLEKEVDELKQSNECLKRKNVKSLMCIPTPTPRPPCQLRRAHSSGF